MLVNELRENRYAVLLILVLRLYLGWQWMMAGGKKLLNGFDATGFLRNVVEKPVVDKATNELIYPLYTAFIEHAALPYVQVINFVIPVGEFLVGLGLIVGLFTTTAAGFGLLMNFMFLFGGSISKNPWFVLIGGVILLSGTNAGRYGLDRYLLPIVNKWKN
jgi:thiosulfate dehydrogenase (quinone) large subunit